jgi:hypothetical protein
VSQDDEAFRAWLVHGVTRRWISMPVCVSHSPVPTTPEEDVEIILTGTGDDEDIIYIDDPCIFALRVWKEIDEDEYFDDE